MGYDREQLREQILDLLTGGVVLSTGEITGQLGYRPPDDQMIRRQLNALAHLGKVRSRRERDSRSLYWSRTDRIPIPDGVEPVDLDAPLSAVDPAAGAARLADAPAAGVVTGQSGDLVNEVRFRSGPALVADARQHGVRVLAPGELAELVRHLSLVTVFRARAATLEVSADPVREVEQITLRLELGAPVWPGTNPCETSST